MTLSDALMLLALTISIAAMLYTLLTTRALLTKQMAQEQRLSNLPSLTEFTEVRIKLAEINAQQQSVLNEAHGARQAARRVEDFLLKATKHHESKF